MCRYVQMQLWKEEKKVNIKSEMISAIIKAVIIIFFQPEGGGL